MLFVSIHKCLQS